MKQKTESGFQKKVYLKDIRDLTLTFSIKLLSLVRELKTTFFSSDILKQIIRSGSSIGANIAEAKTSLTRREYRHKLSIALKEARETDYWLNHLFQLYPERSREIDILGFNLKEIIAILQSSINRLKDK